MISRELLDQLGHLLGPLSTRIANIAARAVVHLVDDTKKTQRLQLEVLKGEIRDNAEHFQSYGFSSVPLPGAEAVVVFPNGDRGHPLVAVVSDKRYKPIGREPGEVTVYNNTGAKITMTKDGDIEVQPAPGREVFIRDAGGDADRLVKKSEFDGHTHSAGVPPDGYAAPSGGGPVTGTSGGAAAVAGTQKLRVQ